MPSQHRPLRLAVLTAVLTGSGIGGRTGIGLTYAPAATRTKLATADVAACVLSAPAGGMTGGPTSTHRTRARWQSGGPA
jgi:hypothetical protein